MQSTYCTAKVVVAPDPELFMDIPVVDVEVLADVTVYQTSLPPDPPVFDPR